MNPSRLQREAQFHDRIFADDFLEFFVGYIWHNLITARPATVPVPQCLTYTTVAWIS